MNGFIDNPLSRQSSKHIVDMNRGQAQDLESPQHSTCTTPIESTHDAAGLKES
jgi:hypothetical protein